MKNPTNSHTKKQKQKLAVHRVDTNRRTIGNNSTMYRVVLKNLNTATIITIKKYH